MNTPGGRAQLLVKLWVLEGSVISQSLCGTPQVRNHPFASYWRLGNGFLVVYYNFIILILMTLF